MAPELSAFERCKILRQRLRALNINTSMEMDDRLGEIRRAEKALILATRDLEQEERVRNKLNRASKPLESESARAARAWTKGYDREARQK